MYRLSYLVLILQSWYVKHNLQMQFNKFEEMWMDRINTTIKENGVAFK